MLGFKLIKGPNSADLQDNEESWQVARQENSKYNRVKAITLTLWLDKSNSQRSFTSALSP